MNTPENKSTPTIGNDGGVRTSLTGGDKIAASFLVMIPVGLVGIFLVWICFEGGSGSADAAKELIREIKILGPDSEPLPISGYATKKYDNGEWIVGVGKDSHGFFAKLNGGGTLVVKDSRGDIRCFLGHVCGPGGLRDRLSCTMSLDDFYKELIEWDTFGELRFSTNKK